MVDIPVRHGWDMAFYMAVVEFRRNLKEAFKRKILLIDRNSVKLLFQTKSIAPLLRCCETNLILCCI